MMADEVRGHGGDRDDRDALAELKAAGRAVEGDDAGDQRSERPRTHQPSTGLGGIREVLDRDVGDPEKRAGGRPEKQSLGPIATLGRVEILTSGPPRRGWRTRRRSEPPASSAARMLAPVPVMPMTMSAAVVIVTPIHWRRPRWRPKKRSASTARKTSPPERTACTIDSGASASAPTCSPQATIATMKPTKNHWRGRDPPRCGADGGH